MLVGVVSDTHDSLERAARAAQAFKERGVSAVIHLGDVIAPFTLRPFLELGARFEGVFGNNDGERMGLSRLAAAFGASIHDPPRSVVIGGKRFLLVHGFGDPDSTVEIVRALAESGRWHAVLYGHTHEPLLTYRRGVLLLNPGDGGGVLNRSSYALVDTETMRARLVELD
ncbi:MAG: metallophosphoesterase [Acidilobaceae archaeon]